MTEATTGHGLLPDDQGRFAERRARDGGHFLHLNGRRLNALTHQRGAQGDPERRWVDMLRLCQEHHQSSVTLLLDLPAGGADGVHDVVEDERLDGAGMTVGSGEIERFLLSALDAADERVGPAAGAAVAGGRHLQAVAHLIADQRQGAREEDGDQHLGAILSGRHWPVVGIDHFGDDEVLEEVQAGVLAALGSDAGGLGGAVDCTVDGPRRPLPAGGWRLSALRRR
jgi:hypothetical protein